MADRTRRTLLLFLLFSLFFLLTGHALRTMIRGTGRGFVAPQDDVYIYVRYAESLASSAPFVFTADGARSQGFNGFVLLALLGLAAWAGMEGHALAALAVALGALSLGLIVLAVFLRLEGWAGPRGAFATALLVLLHGQMLWGTLCGLEGGLFALALLLALWPALGEKERPGGIPSIVATASLPFFRPEGLVLAAALFGLHGLRRAHRRGALLLVPLGILLFLTLSWQIDGRLLPNTGTKSLLSHDLGRRVLEDAVTVARRFLVQLFGFGEGWLFFPLCLPLALWAAVGRRRKRLAPAMILLLGLALAIYGSTRGVGALMFRYMLPYLPLLLILFGEAVEAAARRSHGLIWLLPLLWSLPGTAEHGELLARGARATAELHVRAAEAIARRLPRGAIVAAGDVGALACFGERPLVDLVGLTDGRFTGLGRFGDGPLWERLGRLPPAKRPAYLLVYPNRFTDLQSPLFMTRGLLREMAVFETKPPFYRHRRLRLLAIASPDYWAAPLPPSTPPGLLPSDSLDLGDRDDELGHGLVVTVGPGEVPVTPLLCLPERTGRFCADGGRLLRGLACRMKLRPGRKHCLVLRRTSLGRPAMTLRLDGSTIARWPKVAPEPSGGVHWVEERLAFQIVVQSAEAQVELDWPDASSGEENSWSLHGLWLFGEPALGRGDGGRR